LCGKNLSTEAVVLVAEPGREVEAATRLRRIAFDAVAGYLAGGMQPLDAAPELVDRIERVTARSLSEQLAAAAPPQLIDVRSPREWHERHIEQAINIPLAQLPDRLDTLPRDRPLVVHCASDYRSSIGASLIRRAGLEDVTVLVGGLAAWESATLATVGTP
jgi:rhodanese-related sulfurtransferase